MCLAPSRVEKTRSLSNSTSWKRERERRDAGEEGGKGGGRGEFEKELKHDEARNVPDPFEGGERERERVRVRENNIQRKKRKR